ncbi:MAG: AraC family transcriptional regulator [Clostridiales bacterium]|jgi:predicted transcriptional regulator YdeE|nr:AraC family transcriptional regulator [Clostridiales bacterium]MCI8771729.1 AraC family transcriptional regulator [Lachnospiraceae bacterium]
MKYTICEIEAFSVIGQEVELTNFQKRNIQISTQLWRKFNSNLKKSYLSQSGNWIKYAFMEKRNGKLFYFCSIPKRNIVPERFIYKEIQAYKYLVVEHIGSMDKIYETYCKIYKELLPNTEYALLQKDFLHFERYDYRFHWNRGSSIIEIWLPIKS